MLVKLCLVILRAILNIRVFFIILFTRLVIHYFTFSLLVIINIDWQLWAKLHEAIISHS